MKKLILPVLLAFLFSCSKKTVSIKESTKTTAVSTTIGFTSRFTLNDKLYNKVTGEPISMEEFAKIVKENPNVPLEKIYDKYGVPEKVFYHPNPPENFGKRNPELQPKVGEPFPQFVFQTIDGKEIDLENLKGKWVLVRFDFFTEVMNKEDFSQLIESIDQLPKSSKFIPILCSMDNKENLKRDLGSLSKKIDLVSDGQGFSSKYQIMRFPTTILIAPDQTLYKYLGKNEYQEIGSIIE